ncbi:TIGR02234 family membrane protein [Streptomyces sp. NPDC060194]|uniref:TIGR02234 family membrane protein n=1 Tax=Streptomyces sp. NPDC060194 TaxID=3347069 RepID=UPI0036697673
MSAVPQPRAESPDRADAPAPDSRGSRRSLAAALLLGAVGATVVLIASRQTWAEGRAAIPGGSLPQSVSGGDVTGAPAALAIVGLAALVAVFAVRRTGRVLVSALLALSGAGIVLAAALGASDTSALDEKAATVSGDPSATIDALSRTPWPWVVVGGGVLILLAGLLALRHGRSWPSMGGRYERDGSPRASRARAPRDPERPEEMWKALDRGEDPTGGAPAGDRPV